MNLNYKKYSLENLENWIHDSMSCAEVTPQEIYDVIVGVVKENYYTCKHQTEQAYELLALLNGNGKELYDSVMKEKEYYEPSMPPWGHSDLEYLANDHLTQDRNSNFPNENTVEDKVVKWQLPIEVSDDLEEYVINLPEDLLEAANLQEGDNIEWIDSGDGTYLMKKIEKKKTYDEIVADGYTMTADGFWIPPNE